ncbi:hypothetical protein M2256_001863 [Lactococcus lactis]|uniref:Phage protein n=1 Tax=Lactococcus lactis TaxID=1358 RepID=A0AAW5TWK2_9LACT|nr:hypothetical protein [Lactococcus lactis]
MLEVIIGFVGITFIMYILFFMLALPPKNGTTQFTRPPRFRQKSVNSEIKRDTYTKKWLEEHMD